MAQIVETEIKIPFKVPLDKSVHKTIKMYAIQTDQTMSDVLKEQLVRFESDAIRIANEIEVMREKALEKKLKEEADAKLAAEHPIKVSGFKEDPIGNLEVEPRAF